MHFDYDDDHTDRAGFADPLSLTITAAAWAAIVILLAWLTWTF